MIRTKKYYISRLKELKGEYSSEGYKATDEEKELYLFPNGMNRVDAKSPSDGNRKDEYILNNTALLAIRVAVSGLFSGTTPATEQWTRLRDEDDSFNENLAVSEFYQKSTDRLLFDFDNSNFYSSMELMYKDMLVFNRSCILMDEDFEDVFFFTHVPVGQYYVDVDYKGRISALYREFTKRARNVIEEYGIENVSTEVAATAKNNSGGGKMVTLLHVIERNSHRDIDKLDNMNMPWTSVTCEVSDTGDEKFLRKSGYKHQPFVVPRWNVSSGSKYGDGPGDLALGDAKELQFLMKKLKLAIAQEVEPSLVSTDPDSSIKIGPRKVTVTSRTPSGKPAVEPLFRVEIDISKLVALIIDTQERIKDAFYSNLFFALSGRDNKQRTATEIVAITNELLRLLGGAMQRIPKEALFPIIERAFMIELENGRLPDIPQELQGRPMKVDIISRLTKAQELNSVSAIEQILGVAGHIAGMIPDVLDKIDADQAIDELNRVLGVKPGIIRPDEVVAELREIRSQRQLEQQATLQAQQSIESAKTLSETDVSGDNALNLALGAA